MQRREQGFTLIELIIVVVVIAIIASIAIPNLLSSRVNANESAAVQTLKSISSAQAQCQASRAIDDNTDGAGEFGYLGELSGGNYLRERGGISTTELISPAVLSQGFSQIENGCVRRSGYMFRMYLPDATDGFVPEAPTGGSVAGAVDASSASVLWCCYAWPAHFEQTGRRAFFVNQRGDVLGCRNATARYDGLVRPPIPGTAAFVTAGSIMSATLAANTVGADGERWAVVN